MTNDGIPVMRFTDKAMAQLNELAESEPELWLDPETDFLQILREKGVEQIEEHTGLTAAGPIGMPLPGLERRRQSVDRHALGFLDNLPGITPRQMADGNLLAWLSCVHMLEFGIMRWPPAIDRTRWVKIHFLPRRGRSITDYSTAGRNLWIAWTSRRTAQETTAATERETLDHLAEYPEHYHYCTAFEVMRSPPIVSEYTLALMTEAQGTNRDGAREIARDINRAAAPRILESLSKRETREIINAAADRVMRQPRYVNDRSKLRGRKNLQVLSLGAGVQSSAMALMAEHGYLGFKKPDLAIFADTGWEPKKVYENLEWIKTQLSYPVITVSNGNIRDSILSGVNPEGRKVIDMPVYVMKEDGKKYIATRQCTRIYKMEPIYRYLREYLGIPAGKTASMEQQVDMWIGISRDEASRVKPSRKNWITNVHPLVDMDVSREQLEDWFRRNYQGRELPKSACIGCPFHNDRMWLDMKENDPESFQEAAAVEWAMQNMPQSRGALEGKPYLHKSHTALALAEFDPNSNRGGDQQEECEGFCQI